MSNFDVSVLVRLVDQLTGPAKKVQASMQQMANAMRQSAAGASTAMANSFQRAFLKIGNAFKNFHAEMGRHWSNLQSNAMGSVLLTAAFEHSLEKQMHFEEVIMNMRAFRLDKEGVKTDELREKIVRLSAMYPILGGRMGLAEGAEAMMKAGQSTEDVIAMLKPIAMISAAAHIDAKTASEGLVHMAYASGLPTLTTDDKVKTAEYAGNALFAAMKAFGGKYEELVSALTRGGPASRVMGVPSSVAIANIAAQLRAGFPAESAGIALNALMLRMGTFGEDKQSKDAYEKLRDTYGVDIKDFRHSADEFAKYGGNAFAKSIGAATGTGLGHLAPKFQELMNDPILQGSADLMRTRLMEAIVGTGKFDTTDAKQMGNLYRNLDKEMLEHFSQTDVLAFYRAMAKSGAYKDIGLMKKIAGVYHLPKFADIDFQVLTGEFDTKLNDFYEHITGATQIHLDLWGDGVAGAWKRAGAMLGVFQERFWKTSGLLNVFHELLTEFLVFSDKILNASPATLAALRYIGEGLMLIAAATGAGLVLMGVGAALSTLLNPITLAAAGIAYLSYEIWKNWDALGAWWNRLSTAAQLLVGGGGLAAGLGVITLALRAFMVAVMASPLGWAVRLATFGVLIYENWDRVVGVFERLKTALEEAMKPVDNFFKGTGKAIESAFGLSKDSTPEERARMREMGLTPAGEDSPLHAFLKKRREGATLSGRTSGAATRVTQNVNAPVTVNLHVQNAVEAPGAVSQALGDSINSKIRAGLFDLPQ